MAKGQLYLIPNFINDQNEKSVFPEINKLIVSRLRYFTFEHIKDARRFIAKIGLREIIDQSEFYALDKKSTSEEINEIIQQLLKGNDVGVLSDAGVPCVADPGSKLVKAAHHHQLKVTPLVGPSSILLALMASGLNGQSFAFHGYLEREAIKRGKQLQKLEQESRQYNQTQLFMDTPYRNEVLYESIMKNLNGTTLLSIAKEIGGTEEEILMKSISDWKASKPMHLSKKLAIFSILAQ